MAIKLDMAKAYDRVELDFVGLVMSKVGFSHIFIKWILACISSSLFYSLLMGSHVGMSYHLRILDRGNPISPIFSSSSPKHSLIS